MILKFLLDNLLLPGIFLLEQESVVKLLRSMHVVKTFHGFQCAYLKSGSSLTIPLFILFFHSSGLIANEVHMPN